MESKQVLANINERLNGKSSEIEDSEYLEMIDTIFSLKLPMPDIIGTLVSILNANAAARNCIFLKIDSWWFPILIYKATFSKDCYKDIAAYLRENGEYLQVFILGLCLNRNL